VERDGLFGAPPIEVVVSDESHRTIFTALRMLGLGAERVRRVETDAQGRMRPDRLARTLQGGTGPCIVCAQIGNVNTGAADPIGDIASFVRERGAWLHVDAAFGLWAATSASRRSLVAGIELADSIATDAHKWFVPYDSGIVLTAHPDAHQQSLLMPAHYIQMTPGEREPRSFTPDESRRARGLPPASIHGKPCDSSNTRPCAGDAEPGGLLAGHLGPTLERFSLVLSTRPWYSSRREVAMAAAYSMDLRARVLKDADAGRSSKELAERYHVSRAWVDALKQRRRETGSVAPRKQTKFRGRVLASLETRLAALIAARPDATLTELREALPTTAGLSTLWRAIDRLGFTVKKNGTRRRTTSA
jgi:transposase